MFQNGDQHSHFACFPLAILIPASTLECKELRRDKKEDVSKHDSSLILQETQETKGKKDQKEYDRALKNFVRRSLCDPILTSYHSV